MSKKVKVCLALFLSFAVLAQYSFTPQAMVAYGLNGDPDTVAASSSEQPEQEATNPAPEPSHATEAPTQAPAATTESTQATESTEATTVPEEQSDDVEDENDVNTGDPIAGEDQAADEEEAAEEDVEYPAVSFTRSAGGVTVHISAPEGALPEGATVKVSAVSAEQYMGAIESAVGSEVEKAKAVDITFYNKDGKETKPKRAVSVSMSASGISADSVVHIADGGSANASIYALVDEAQDRAEDRIITITYKAGNGGSVSSGGEKVNLNGESVEVSGSTATADNGYAFVNWTDGEGNEVSTEASFTPDVSKLDGVEGEVTFTANFAEQIEVTFDPTTDPDEQLAPITVSVNKGEKIGDSLPSVPEIPGYSTKWVIKGSSTPVTADTIVEEPFTAGVDKGDKITYTVTFVQADGTTTETRTTDIDAGFAINDLPEVAPQTNKVGKWVYPGTTNEFTVGTVISENLTVNAYYEQNIFTVTFMVDNAQYEQMTTATGTTIVLPSDPIKSGMTFEGWFTEPDGKGTQYTAESTVKEDLTLYAYFKDQVRVRFLVKDDDGNVISEKSQYFIDLTVGDKITTLPEDPFMEGKTFVRWVDGDGSTVEEGYTVTESFDAVAEFSGIKKYELTVNYFYKNDAGTKVPIGNQVYDLVGGDFPYTVTAPGYTIATEVTDEPTYYPSQPTITVKADQFVYDEEKGMFTYKVDDEYVAADAQYKVGHYLKDLDGDGYNELIETVNKEGVKNSRVTPDINNYAYAVYNHRDEDVLITDEPDQELKVYYDRRDFTLSYNVGEGDYIDAVTKPYGTEITLPTTATRTGYKFDGWYKDDKYTEEAGSSITLEKDTTLYAKWKAAQSEYKIVYMIENADDDGYSYLATVTKSAETGSSITMTAQTAGATGTRPRDLDTTNFTFKDSTTEKVKADGTTVVVVRYSRNVYTITWEGSGYGLWWGNPYWQTGQGRATLSAKYGANISARWTATFNTPHPDWAWNFSRSENDEKFTSLDIMPSGNKTVYHWYYSTTKTQTLNYWMENYDGTRTTTYNGRTYGLFKSVTVHYNYLYDTDYPDYAGYTKGGWVRSDGARRLTDDTPNGSMTADFYYNALKHPLTFYNYDGTLISTEQVTLNENIYNRIRNAIPSAPMEGATWKGWFTDSEHKNEYTYSANTKMPAGLVLYGDFKFPTRTVTFDSQGGSTVAEQTDEYGFHATAPADPEKEGYVFQGWFTAADETGSPYDWHKPVTEDITLYAHWTQKTISYTVHYYETDSTTSVVPDKVVSDPNLKQGDEITETAPTVAGHVADKAEKSIELSFDEKKNVIIFYYDVIPDELTYEVNYVLKDHPNIKVAESKEVTVPGTTTNALEMAVEVDKAYMKRQTTDANILDQNYKPTETSQELQLALTGNVITFEYVPYTSAKITVNYLDMDGNEIEDTDTSFVEVGDTFTVQNKAPDGYVYHHAYLHGTKTAPQPTYQITGDEGNIEIDIYYQKKLIILANNKAKTYDGTPLKSSFETEADYTITGTLRGDTVTSIEFVGSQTDAGTSATTPKNAQISKGADAITDPETYYSIIYVPGSLTVKPVSVYISVSADQWNTHSGGSGPNYYTGNTFYVGFTNPGKQHFNDETGKSAYVSITSGQRALFKAKYGDAIWNALYGTNGALISEKDAGTYTYSGAQQKALLSAVTVGGKAMMSDPNYSITLYARDSFLQIDPLPLNIKTESAEKEYDGTALTENKGTIEYHYWTANIGGSWKADTKEAGAVTLGTGDAITFTVDGEQTEVGQSYNTYQIDWGDTKSSNYKISESLGTLTVTRPALSITVNGKSSGYNGVEQSGYVFPESITGTGEEISTDDYTVKGLIKGDTLKVSYTPAKGKDVNTNPYNGSFAEEYTIVDADGKDVKKSYKSVTWTPGTLTITPAPLTITTPSANKVYDGTPLTAEGSIDGFVNGETATFKTTGSQTVAGESDNTYSLTWDGTAIKGNYKITTETIGKLTVTENTDEIVVTTTGGTFTYDGKPHGATVKVEGLPKGYTLVKAESTANATNAGTTASASCNILVIENAAHEDVTAKLNIKYVDGTITITKAPLTITTPSATKEYDGTPLKAEGSISGFVNGETATFKTTGSQTEVGKSDNTYTLNWNGTALESNYEIKATIGTLTVEKVSMTITVNGNTSRVKYNGNEQTLEGYTPTSPSTMFDKEKVDYSGKPAVASGTNAGVYTMGLNAEYFSYKDSRVNATFVVADGTLTIAPRDVTVTSASATKVYDGTALTNNGITISGDGFVTGETPAFRVTGSQTAVGSSKNTFDILPNNVQSSAVLDLVTAAANGYVASNYNIDKVYGTLTVTQAATPTPTPVPDNDGNNPGGGNPAVAAVNPIPAAAIDDTPAPTTINDEPAPRAAAGFWALINLICAILTALLSLIMLIRYFGKRREEDEETGEVTEIKRKGGVKLASIIPAIGAIVAFILTEDMTLPMQMVDKWTVLMVVILAIQALVAFFSRKKEEEEDQEDEGAMA